MPDSCCVYGCANHREENRDQAVYRFPRGKKEEQQELPKKWIQACKRENCSEQQINNARICGDHFITSKYHGLVHYLAIFNWCTIYLSRAKE